MNEKSANGFRISTEMIVSLSVIFVSIATLFVYVYQARIMQSQLHASVWPYVEWGTTNYKKFEIIVQNKGIGPALVKNLQMKIDGKKISGYAELLDSLFGKKRQKYFFITSYLNRRVLAAGEIVKPIQVEGSLFATKIDSALRKHNFELEICYCSIYNDCWKTNGLEVVESDCK
jgi:hypothetical protein